jgi:hypothetical protein
MRLVTPSVHPNGLSDGTAVGITAASIASAPRVAVASSLMVSPSAAAPSISWSVTPVMPGRPMPRAVGGRRPTVAGSSHRPKARRARITSLLTASSPSTSPLGSASA